MSFYTAGHNLHIFLLIMRRKEKAIPGCTSGIQQPQGHYTMALKKILNNNEIRPSNII